MDDIVISLVALFLLLYGLYMLVWPEKALELYLSQVDLTSPTKWHKPKTWRRERPPVVFFQAAGVFLIIVSLCLAYGLIKEFIVPQ
jgi:hypothetical protein